MERGLNASVDQNATHRFSLEEDADSATLLVLQYTNRTLSLALPLLRAFLWIFFNLILGPVNQVHQRHRLHVCVKEDVVGGPVFIGQGSTQRNLFLINGLRFLILIILSRTSLVL